MDLQDNRFKTLIEPIKDLASNWDIDIADSLNDYLEELSTLKISLDDGQTQLNFAEAALLIQGSAAVYSKKVEYLYQLVIQSIEFITKKKSQVLSKGKKGEEKSMMEDDLLLFGNDPSFLLLDNIIEEGTNIDLKLPNLPDQSFLSNESFHNSSVLNTSHVNVSLLHSALQSDQGGAFLKLTGSVDSNGALMIGDFRPAMMLPKSGDIQLVPSFPPARPTDVANVEVPMDVVVDDGYDGGYDGGFDDWNSEPIVVTAPLVLQGATKPVHKPSLRPQKVYVLLDPHAVIGGSRPAKKGRTFRLPTSMAKQKKDTAFNPAEELFDEYWQHDSWRNFQLNRPSHGSLQEPCLLPLLKARKTIEKRVQAQQRFKRSKEEAGRLVGDDWGDAGDGDYFEEADADPMMDMIYGHRDQDDAAVPSNSAAVDQQLMSHYEPDGPDMDFGSADVGMDGDVDNVLDEEEELARRVEAALQSDNNYQHSYEMICKQFIDNFHRGAEAFARESQLSKRVNEWTYKLEPILQAQEEAKPFDIHECSDEVLATLSVETNILAKNGTASDKKTLQVPFHNIADGQTSAEVCRKFLSCLQLANLGNVEIVANKGPGRQLQMSNDFQLKLVSDARAKDLENFRAPSLR